MLKTVLFLNTLLLFLLTGSLNATTYYVDNAAGSDGNTGKSTSAPWKTIGKVNGFTFAAGDTVSFKGGQTFTDASLIPPRNGSSGLPMVFNSYGTGKATLDAQGNYVTVQVGYRNYLTFYNLRFIHGHQVGMGGNSDGVNIGGWDVNNLLIDHCNIDYSYQAAGQKTANAYFGADANSSTNIVIRYSTINYAGGSHGIYLDGVSNCTLEYDTISYNWNNAIRIAYGNNYQGTNNLIVRYCVMKGNVTAVNNGTQTDGTQWDATIHDDGSVNAQYYYNVIETRTNSSNQGIIKFIDEKPNGSVPPRGIKFYNNTCIIHTTGSENYPFEFGTSSGDGYPDISGMTNMDFRNNIIYSDVSTSRYFYLHSALPTGWNINNNCYYGGGGWNINGTDYTAITNWKTIGFDANGFISNPLFTTNFTNLALQSTSPCISTGTNVALTMDINGNPVPQPPDMGALQHVSGGGGGGGGTIPPSTLNLTALIEALYAAGGTAMTISPMVTVELHSSTSPYALVDSNSALLNPAGTGTFKFTKAVNGTGYYIVVKYMNALATWSASPQSFTSSALSYNFTTAVTQAYTDGSNLPLALHNGKYCLYSGDLNQDGVVNTSDYTGVDSDNSTFNFHSVNDLNGDGLISSADEQFIDNNFIKSIHRQAPAGAL